MGSPFLQRSSATFPTRFSGSMMLFVTPELYLARSIAVGLTNGAPLFPISDIQHSDSPPPKIHSPPIFHASGSCPATKSPSCFRPPRSSGPQVRLEPRARQRREKPSARKARRPNARKLGALAGFRFPPLTPPGTGTSPQVTRPAEGAGRNRKGPSWETEPSSPPPRGRSAWTSTGMGAATPSSRCFGTASSRAAARRSATTTGGRGSARSSATSSGAH